MRNYPEVHWAEGMFLRPQHLQVFQHQVMSRIAVASRQSQPFFWGVSAIDVADDQLEGGHFEVRRFEATLKDGTRLAFPTNLHLPPREFRQALNRSDGTLPVWMGVPVQVDGQANTVSRDMDDEDPGARDLRYRVTTVEVADENLGGAPRELEVRKYNGRFFFGDEIRDGYECLPIAVIQRTGQGKNRPVLASTFIPPLTDVSAWKALVELGESVLHRVEAKYRYLRAEVAEQRLVLDSEGTGGWQPVLKLQIVGSFLHVLRQLVAVPGAHPFQLYLELSRLAGELSIFEEEGAESLDVDLYDHDQLGHCFRRLVFTVNRLLDKILSGDFRRVPFVLEEGELLIARLEEDWPQDSDIYLCIVTDRDDEQLRRRLMTAKIGASRDLPLLEQRRLFGLAINLLGRTPGRLPARENYHYFTIEQKGEYWENVCHYREVAVSGGIDSDLRFVLYIVPRAGSVR